MKFALFAVAALLLAMGALAGDKKFMPFSGKDQYNNVPMQCTGHAYCFPGEIPKIGGEPTCPAGYTLDSKAKTCYKSLGATCESGITSKDSYGKVTCLECNKDETFDAKTGLCAKECKKGYMPMMVNGLKMCVEMCKEGYTPSGTDCVTDKHSYEPKECSDKKCNGLFKYELYFLNGKNSYNVKSAEGSKAYDSYTKGAYAPKGPACVCMKTYERKVYEQECNKPEIKDPKVDFDTCDAICMDGKKPGLFGKCKEICPAGCTETGDKCQMGCPAGFHECGKGGKKFCATNSPLFGCDSCEVLEKMYKHLDESMICKPPVVKPTKPTPVKAPKL